MNVAVFNTEARKAVPIVRSLGRAGYRVVSFSFERISFAASSRYVSKNIFIRRYDLERIRRLVEEHRIDVILPIEDPSIEFFALHRDAFPGYTLVIPPYDAFILFADKAKTVRFARERGVVVPDTFIPESVEEALDYLRDRAPFPRLIKPRRATSAIGVRIVRCREEAVRHYLALSERFHLPIIQEYVPPGGAAIGAEFLYYRGREILCFAHQRIREFPVGRGPSTYCRNYRGDDALDEGRKCLRDIGYSGFAMVEFKRHPESGKLYLMEINPRPWGSITLPISAGVDFPVEAVRIFSDPERYRGPSGSAYDRTKDYYMRWLLPGDLLSIVLDARMPLGEKLRQLLRRYPDTAYQIMSFDDPMPGLVMTVKLALNLFHVGYLRKYLLRKW